MKSKIIIIIAFVFVQNVTSQTIEEVLSNIYAQYSAKEPLQFNMTYNLYKSFSSEKVHQSYNGVYHKNASNAIYMKINETEILNNKEVSIKVSHEDKALLVSNPELNVDGAYDMSKLLEVYKKESFEDKNTYWEIELIAKEVTSEYSKIRLHISKDYFLQKQVFFYANAINFSKDYKTTDIQTPRLEILYTDYSKKVSDEHKFKTVTFLQIKKGAPVVLSPGLKGYELIDKR